MLCRMQAAVSRHLHTTNLELSRRVVLLPRQIAPALSMPLCSLPTIRYSVPTLLHKVHGLLVPLSFVHTVILSHKRCLCDLPSRKSHYRLHPCLSVSLSGRTRGLLVKCEIPWEHVPYLSALEVCSRRGAIQIHFYLYLYLSRSLFLWHASPQLRNLRKSKILGNMACNWCSTFEVKRQGRWTT